MNIYFPIRFFANFDMYLVIAICLGCVVYNVLNYLNFTVWGNPFLFLSWSAPALLGYSRLSLVTYLGKSLAPNVKIYALFSWQRKICFYHCNTPVILILGLSERTRMSFSEQNVLQHHCAVALWHPHNEMKLWQSL